jgi:uncharacterized protein (DUF433 family)
MGFADKYVPRAFRVSRYYEVCFRLAVPENKKAGSPPQVYRRKGDLRPSRENEGRTSAYLLIQEMPIRATERRKKKGNGQIRGAETHAQRDGKDQKEERPRTMIYSQKMEKRMTANKNVIVRDPEILGGTPVFRGTRVPLKNLFDYLEGGETLEEFLEGFPSVTREMAIAALEEAKELLSARA